MSETVAAQSERTAFMKEHGFVLYNDVTEQLFDYLSKQPLQRINPGHDEIGRFEYQRSRGRIYTSTFELYTLTGHLEKLVPTRTTSSSVDIAQLLGFTADDLHRANDHTFDLGVDDLDFPWHFTPAVAQAIVHDSVKADKVSAEEAESLTLTDWADLIQADDFKNLMNTLSLTGFAVYKRFGTKLSDYQPDTLKRAIEKEAKDRGCLSPPKT
jgi:hypothetical protein